MNAEILGREARLFIRRNRWLSILAMLIVSIGFSGSMLTLVIMLTLSTPKPDGMRAMSFITIAQEMEGGTSRPVNWIEFSLLTLAAGGSDPKLIPYSVPAQADLSVNQRHEQVVIAGVASGFFNCCVEGAFVGRDFSNPFVIEGTSNEVILSSHLAARLFGEPQSALGQHLQFNGRDYVAVGIAPESFQGLWLPHGVAADAWLTPKNFAQLMLRDVSAQKGIIDGAPSMDFSQFWAKAPMFYVLGVSSNGDRKQMRIRLDEVFRSETLVNLHWHSSSGITNDEVHERKLRSWASLAFLMSIILIIAAGLNFSNLLLSQVPKRVAEVRLKRVLGGSSARIMLESISGPLVVFLSGIGVALLITAAVLRILFLSSGGLLASVTLPWRAVLGSIVLNTVVAIGVAVVVAILPGLRLIRDSGVPRLGYTSTRSRTGNAFLQAIVSLQIASCIVMCMLASNMIESVRTLSKDTLGYESTGLTVASLVQDERRPFTMTANDTYDFPLSRLTRDVLSEASGSLAGNQIIAVAGCAPSSNAISTLTVSRTDKQPEHAYACGVTKDFFKTIEDSFYLGSGFTTDSLIGRPTEVVINRQLAGELWPNQNPLHQTLRIQDSDAEASYATQVVGVVDDVRFVDLTSEPVGTIYLPLRGNVFLMGTPPLYVLTRGQSSSRAIADYLKARLAASETGLGIGAVYRADDKLRIQRIDEQHRGYVAVFGAIMVALIAYLGLFGSLMHFVHSRRKELAVRVCFGASRYTIQRIVVSQALLSGLIAALVSLMSGRVVVQIISVKWLGVTSWSWGMGWIVSVVCVAAALAISILPASAAAKVSPADVLKEQ